MDATDLDRVKTWLREKVSGTIFSGTDLDAVLTELITACSAALEAPAVLNRPLLKAARTEVYVLSKKPRHRTLALRAAPVDAAAAFTLKESSTADWVGVEALDSGSDFVLVPASGFVRFPEPLVGPTMVQVTYTAGLAADLTTLAAAYPDLVHATTMWVGMLFERRRNLDATVRSSPGGGGAKTWSAPMAGPPPVVEAMLKRYRRSYAA